VQCGCCLMCLLVSDMRIEVCTGPPIYRASVVCMYVEDVYLARATCVSE